MRKLENKNNRILKEFEEQMLSSEDKFLDFAYEKMFAYYVKKTFSETRKKYLMNWKKYVSYNLLLDDIDYEADIDVLSNTTVPYEELVEDKRLYKYLKLLTNKQKFIIFEYYVNNKSEQEIGKILGITKQAVNKSRKKALEKNK